MKRVVRHLVLFGVLLAVPTWAEAVTRYAAPSGGITNCTTMQNPATPGTPAAAVGCMASGDRLEFKAGTYSLGRDSLSLPSGTAGTHTVVATFQNDVATFTQNNPFNLYQSAKQYIDFIGAFIWDGTGETDTTQNPLSFNWASLGGSTNISFDGIRVTNWPGTASNTGSEFITFKNCRFDHNGQTLDANKQAGYAFYIGGSNITIENCQIDNQGGYGIHQFSGQQTPSNNTYRFNHIHHNGQTIAPGNVATGVLIGQGSGTGTKVYGNIIDNNVRGYGIALDGGTGTLIYNNTVYLNGADVGATDVELSASNNFVVNNIGRIVQFSGSGNTYAKNMSPSACAGTLCEFVEASATTFTSPGTDFTLKAGSAAINSGAINIAPGTTIAACSGSIVTGCYNGALPDLGALETGVPTVGGGPPTLTTNITSAPGAQILLTVDDDDVSERIEDTGDWIGMYPQGATTEAEVIDWWYMNGTKTAPTVPISDAVISFTAPSTPGAYEFRFFPANTFNQLAMFSFTVTAPGIVMKFDISTLKIGPSVTWKIGTP